jgi:hypothetical protein
MKPYCGTKVLEKNAFSGPYRVQLKPSAAFSRTKNRQNLRDFEHFVPKKYGNLKSAGEARVTGVERVAQRRRAWSIELPEPQANRARG